MLEGFEFISNIILILTGLFSVIKLWNTVSKPNFLAPIFSVFLLFFWVPSLLDLLISVPQYEIKFYRFQEAAEDFTTGLIYNIYITFILILFLVKMNKKKFLMDKEKVRIILMSLNSKSKYLYFICFIPIILLLFVDNPKMYFVYRAVNPDYEIPQGLLNSLLLNSTLLASISGAVLIFIKLKISKKKYKFFEVLLALTLTFAAAFINGKRFIIPIIVICYGSIYYYCGVKNKRTLLKHLILIISGLVLFIVFYGKNMTGEFDQIYSRLRIDFGREDVTKFVIHQIFIKDKDILEYPMQSFLFNFTFFIPRVLWSSKPFPYAVYLTSSLLGLSEVRLLGWSMTTSIFEECLSNLKYIGFLFPLFYMFLIEKINNLNMVSRFLGMLVLLMLVVVQFSAMNFLFMFFILTLFKQKQNEKLISNLRASI